MAHLSSVPVISMVAAQIGHEYRMEGLLTDASRQANWQESYLGVVFRLHHPSSGKSHVSIMEDIYRLRYEVYCIERNFLDENDYPDGLETDVYDICSAHFAAYNHQHIVGTVRLVQPEADQLYPFEGHCRVFKDFRFRPRRQAAEISRLVLCRASRRGRHRGEFAKIMGNGNNEGAGELKVKPSTAIKGSQKRGDIPQLLLDLYREIYRHSRCNGIRYLYAAMEKWLACSLDHIGFRFGPIGPATDYYGPVNPYIIDLEELVMTLREQNPLLLAWLNEGLKLVDT